MAVTISTIAVALGRTAPPATPEAAQWEMWISDALMLIKARPGLVFADLDPVALDYVVREAVVAQIRRPDDATSIDVAVDDGRVSRTYTTSAGRVAIRDEWWNLLSPGSAGGGAFSTRPGFVPDGWVAPVILDPTPVEDDFELTYGSNAPGVNTPGPFYLQTPPD